MILFGYLDLSLRRVRVLSFQFLKGTPVFFGDGMMIDHYGMTPEMGIEHKGLTVVLRQLVVEGVVLAYLSGKTV